MLAFLKTFQAQKVFETLPVLVAISPLKISKWGGESHLRFIFIVRVPVFEPLRAMSNEYTLHSTQYTHTIRAAGYTEMM